MGSMRGVSAPPSFRTLLVTWVEEDDGSKTSQFRLIHLHVPHLRHQFREHPAGKHTRHTRTISPLGLIGTFLPLESLWEGRKAGERPSRKASKMLPRLNLGGEFSEKEKASESAL